jgi:hypothetical protein
MYPMHPRLADTLIADRSARFQRAARIARLVRKSKEPAVNLPSRNQADTRRPSELRHRLGHKNEGLSTDDEVIKVAS